MPVIKLTNFGGLVPKASARAIPGDGAQEADNLRPDIAEFLPVAGDLTAVANSGVTDPQTLYRMARTSTGVFNTNFDAGWIVKAGAMSFAKSPLNNDVDEMTYATFDDGSAAPRVYTASDTVTGRQLGVPAPTDAPAVSVNVVDEFTTEDRAAGIDNTNTYIYGNARLDCQMAWIGADPPISLDGYANRDSVISGDAEESQQVRIFRATSSGGAFNGDLDDDYTGVPIGNFSWIKDPSLGGYWQTQGSGWPAWATAGADHWLVPFAAYGRTYTVDTTSLAAALVMATPGVDGVPLLTSDQITEVIGKINDYLTWKGNEAAPKVAALKAKVQQIHTILDYGVGTESVASYYASTPITDLIAAAVANAAEAIWNEAVKAHATVDMMAPDPSSGGL